jgi:hypothetical protein
MTNPIIPTLFHQDRILLVAKLQGLYLTSRDMSGAPHNEHAMCVRITHAPWACMGVAVGPTAHGPRETTEEIKMVRARSVRKFRNIRYGCRDGDGGPWLFQHMTAR